MRADFTAAPLLLSSRSLASLLACASLTLASACSSDETSSRQTEDTTAAADTSVADTSGGSGDTTDGSGDVIDGSGADATPDVPQDTRPDLTPALPEPHPIRITLTNTNPRDPIYVQTFTANGRPGWYNVTTADGADINDEDGVPMSMWNTCGICDCPETTECGTCETHPWEWIELTPGRKVESEWNGLLWGMSTYRFVDCEKEFEQTVGQTYGMFFCWTHDPGGADGMLPPADMSCSRVAFAIGDEEVFYDAN